MHLQSLFVTLCCIVVITAEKWPIGEQLEKSMRKTDIIGAIAHYVRMKNAPEDPAERKKTLEDFAKLDEEEKQREDVLLYESLSEYEKKEAEAAVKEQVKNNRKLDHGDEITAIAHHYRYIRAPLDKNEREEYWKRFTDLPVEQQREEDIKLFDSLSRDQRLQGLKESRKVMESERPDMRMIGHNVLYHLSEEDKIRVRIGTLLLQEEERRWMETLTEEQKEAYKKEKEYEIPPKGSHLLVRDYHEKQVEDGIARYEKLTDEHKKELREKILGIEADPEL